MMFKINRSALQGLVLTVSLSAAQATLASAGAPQYSATAAAGLRVVSTHVRREGSVSVVETRISRGLANGLISPQRLRVTILAADGAVRAEQVQRVGPAQLGHGRSRDAYLSTRFTIAAAPNDHVLVEWVRAAHL